MPHYIEPTNVKPCTEEDLDPDTIPNALAEILDRVERVYEMMKITPPKRRIWSIGAVPEDCNELVVSLAEITPDQEYEENCCAPLRMLVNVTVTRCVPVSSSKSGDKPPTAAQLAKAGKTLGKDAWVLAKSVSYIDLYAMRNLNPEIVVNDPEGGLQSVVLTVSMTI